MPAKLLSFRLRLELSIVTEAEILQHPFLVAPVFLHLDPQLQGICANRAAFRYPPRACLPTSFSIAPCFADDDALLRIPLHEDDRADIDDAVVLHAHILDGHGNGMRNLLAGQMQNFLADQVRRRRIAPDGPSPDPPDNIAGLPAGNRRALKQAYRHCCPSSADIGMISAKS